MLKKFDLSKFTDVFCDNKEALLQMYNNNLKKSALIFTSSPHLLLERKIRTKNLDKYWTAKKFYIFNESIYKNINKVFIHLEKEKKFSIDEILITCLVLNNFHKILYKTSCLKGINKNKKYLNSIIVNRFGLKSLNLNTPWHKILKNQNTLFNYNSVLIKEKSKEGFRKEFKLLCKRFKLNGIQILVSKIIQKYSSIFSFFDKTAFIYGQNELISETIPYLILRSIRIIHFDITNPNKNKKFSKRKFMDIRKCIKYPIAKIIKLWAPNYAVKNCEEIFYKELLNSLDEFSNYKYLATKNLNKKKSKKCVLLTPNHMNPKTIGIVSAFKSLNYPTISFQHGVTPEINTVSKYIAIAHPANNVDYFVAFNKKAVDSANRQNFIPSKSFISGLPSRYFRTNKNYSLLKNNRKKVLYLSMNMYRGNISNFNGNLTDIEKANQEIKILNKLLRNIKHDIHYKPYVLENPRYLDEDPILIEAKKLRAITNIIHDIDARYLVADYGVIILKGASSTLTWAIMSNRPVVFIDVQNETPLNSEAKKLVKKALFYLNLNSRNFIKDATLLLNKSIKELEDLYKSKKIDRERLLKEFFSSYSSNAGKRTAKFIKDIFFHN